MKKGRERQDDKMIEENTHLRIKVRKEKKREKLTTEVNKDGKKSEKNITGTFRAFMWW